MSQVKKPEWTDAPVPTVGEEIEQEIKRQTPRELHVAALAERMKSSKPQTYVITNKNKLAMRVIHDVYGEQVSIPPEGSKAGVVLWPHTAEYLGKGDLELTATAQ